MSWTNLAVWGSIGAAVTVLGAIWAFYRWLRASAKRDYERRERENEKHRADLAEQTAQDFADPPRPKSEFAKYL